MKRFTTIRVENNPDYKMWGKEKINLSAHFMWMLHSSSQ